MELTEWMVIGIGLLILLIVIRAVYIVMEPLQPLSDGEARDMNIEMWKRLGASHELAERIEDASEYGSWEDFDKALAEIPDREDIPT